jgi:hypothetical protein
MPTEHAMMHAVETTNLADLLEPLGRPLPAGWRHSIA